MLEADPPNLDGARETARRAMRAGNREAEAISRLNALLGENNKRIKTVAPSTKESSPETTGVPDDARTTSVDFNQAIERQGL